MDLLALIMAFTLTGAAMAVLHPVAVPLRLLDKPGGRKKHKLATPMIGGLSIYVALLVVALFTPAVQGYHFTLLLISGLIVVVGMVDDMREMRVYTRVLAQSLAAWLMIAVTGVRLETLGDLFGTGPIMLGVMATPVTIMAAPSV